MKNQMMNLFASYSFYYFPGYYYCAAVSVAKNNPLRPKVFRSFGNVKENAEPVFAIAADTGFFVSGYPQTYA